MSAIRTPGEPSAPAERALAKLVHVPTVAEDFAARVDAAGYELYLVGGTVRDGLLGRQHSDLDFAISCVPEETERLLRGWAEHIWLTGARFGTVSAAKGGCTLEVTTFRTEAYAPGSRHPQVAYAGDIEGDLSRRDFTVNAMAIQLPQRRFVDPFGGLRDLRDGVLRTPIEPEQSFADDPLRMVRMARFASVLGAEVDDDARKAAAAMADRLDSVSPERIRAELDKLLVGRFPARGLNLLCDTELADRFLPELGTLRMERDPLHHHKDVYAHTLAVVEGCPPDPVLRLAALLHDIGKPATRAFQPDGKVTFHHHEVVGARMARARLKALRYPNGVIDQVSDLVFLHLRFHGYGDDEWTDSAVRRYVRDAGSEVQLRRLNLLTRADVTTRNRARARRLARAMDALEARIATLAEQEEMAAIKPGLDGNAIMAHLGLRPGPLVGKARAALLEARLDRGPMTEQECYELLDAWAAEHLPR